MEIRAYLSNVSKHWPLARQEALHVESTPGWPDSVAAYQDKLTSRSLKAHSWLDLKHRSAMLRATSRVGGEETIYVASLAVLAWNAEDFMRVAGKAAARGAVIVAHDTGRRIEPTAGAEDLEAAVAELQKAKRAETTGQGRRVGALASAKVRTADAQARADKIRDDWFKSEVPTADLLLRAGRRIKGRRDVVPMSYYTAVRLIGISRPAAQRKQDVDALREQRRQEARERIATHKKVRDPEWLDKIKEGGK